MATYSVDWSAVLSSTAGSVAVGQCLVAASDGTHYVATTANRATYGRAVGFATTAGDVTTPVVQMIEVGPIAASLTGLGTGTASWVRVSATGTLERVTPSGSDDIVGYCETDGSLHSLFGVITATLANGTTYDPTLGGDASGTASAAVVTQARGLKSATTTVSVSAATAPTTGQVLTATSGTVATWQTPASGDPAMGNDVSGIASTAQVDRARGLKSATTTVSVSAATAPTTGQVLTATSGTAATWQTPAASTITGTDTHVMFFDGANNPAGDAGMTYAKATDFLSVAGGFAVGATPSLVGALRFDVSGITQHCTFRSGGADYNFFRFGGGAIRWGDVNHVTVHYGYYNDHVADGTNGYHAFSFGALDAMKVVPTAIKAGVPIIGDTVPSSPYGVHGVGIQAMADANQTPSASVYCYGTIRTTGANTANRDLVLPAATDAAGYTKVIENQCTSNGGTFMLRIKDSGAGTVVYIPNSSTVTIKMDAGGASVVGHNKYDFGYGSTADIAITGDVTLTQDQYVNHIWHFSGAPGGTSTITIPNPSKGEAYTKIVRNEMTSGTLTFTTGAGTTGGLAVGPNQLSLLSVQASYVIARTL